MKSGSEILSALIENEKTNANQLAIGMKLSRTQPLYDILNGKVKKISMDYAEKILAVYPKYNKVWLLGKSDIVFKDPNELAKMEFSYVRLLPISAYGGSLDNFSVSVKDSECERIISPIREADFAITVAGDSMAPEFPHGSQILIKKINDKAFIEWGKVYILDTCNGTTLKILTKSEKDGYLSCSSINPDQLRYGQFDIPVSEIYGIYRVMFLMSIK